VNFAEQGANFIQHLATRNRRRAKPATIATYERYLRNHIVPAIGQMELKEFSNAALKAFGQVLIEKKLSPKSIQEIAAFTRSVVASALGEDGEQLYPRKWNLDYVDLPPVGKQKSATVTPEQLGAGLKSPWGVFYAFLAGTGLRIGEVVAVRIQDDREHTCWDPEASVVRVRTSVWNQREQAPKTPAAIREVDLDPRLNELLKKFATDRTGFLFANRRDGMICPSNIRTLSLKKLGIPGFHCFRRFRITRLRELGTPEDILRSWSGHAGQGITDRYSKLAENVELRIEWAVRAGLGFELPTISEGHRAPLEYSKPVKPVNARTKRKPAWVQPEPIPTEQVYVAADEDLDPIFFAEAV
jgi:integrase